MKKDKPCKHQYQPRYNRTYTTLAIELLSKLNGTATIPPSASEPFVKTETYIHDICVKCGDTKEAKSQ
jgi:hypothetical protein